jgi:hypothetical protein
MMINLTKHLLHSSFLRITIYFFPDARKFVKVTCGSRSVVFSWELWFPVTNKTDSHDITEILLKVAVGNIKPNHILTSIK